MSSGLEQIQRILLRMTSSKNTDGGQVIGIASKNDMASW
jgi:hypothetical protein